MSGIPELEVVGLGAFAGLTIYLGMPFAQARGLTLRTRAALSAFAAGVLVFIFYDVVSQANSLVVDQLGNGAGNFFGYASVLLVGTAFGMTSLIAFEIWFTRRARARAEVPESSVERFILDPKTLATLVAVGIGLHNFSEGLAIGTSYAAGALGLGAVLVIGFAIHNSTEGFGILGPGMMAGTRFSVARLLGLGLVGGGPTLVGTIVGSLFNAPLVSILFYGLAAGAILYVVMQMARPMLGPETRNVALLGIMAGFVLGYVTDLVITFGGG
ncbi:MAG: zinc permease [Thermoplasmata archaeon]|nr:zinc permease [Thermoplasmata archaeon]MCI4355483.1 zinc permease [Thermoplasmata archaeon]